MQLAPVLFQLTLDRNDWNRYQIEGAHRVILPPLSCDLCGETWTSTGEAYPATELEATIVQELSVRKVLSFREFEDLRSRLRPILPKGARISPGATLGAFSGVAKGRPFDIAWNERWTMFLSLDVLLRMRSAGVEFGRVSVPALRHLGRGPAPDLVEPEAVPVIPLSRDGLRQPASAPCAQCGRQAGAFESFVLDASISVPDGCDLFRCVNNSAVYVVTERFAAVVQQQNISGCVLKPLAIAGTVAG